MKEIKILSIKDVIFIVKLILNNFSIQIPDQMKPIVENDIVNYALQIYSEKLKEDSLSTDVID